MLLDDKVIQFKFSCRYHPFYITDSKDGGFSQKTKNEQERERVFAGVEYTKLGMPEATAGTNYIYILT